MKKTSKITASITAVALSAALAAGVIPMMSASAATLSFASRLGSAAPVAKIAAGEAVATAARPLDATVIAAPAATYTAARTTSTRTAATTTGSTAAATSAAPAAAAPAPAVDETAQCQAILAGWIAKYPVLAGTTITMGDARGYQAVSYYTSGRIIVSPTHTASLERIIRHEVGHVLDYRDNGVIDWGENIPAI